MLGYTEGVNYTSADVMIEKYIENTVQPFERWLENTLTRVLDIPGEYIKIPSIETREKTVLIDNAIKQVNSWIITREEARETIGHQIDENELYKEPTVHAGTIRLEDAIVLDNVPDEPVD